MSSTDQGYAMVFGARFRLPGVYQTVPRAELGALLFVCQMASPGVEINFFNDFLTTAKNSHKGRRRMSENDTWDVWEKYFGAVQDKQLVVQVRWTPSHLDTQPNKDKPEWVTADHIRGNAVADGLAERSARDGQIIDREVIRRVCSYTHNALRIQRRWARILTVCACNRTKCARARAEPT